MTSGYGNNAVSVPGNPGWSAEVTVPVNQTFEFYISYINMNTNQRVTYYSTQGISQLCYSVDHMDNNAIDQIMIIGFEDAYDNISTTSTTEPDFNDVVIYLEGELPLPTSKRFFAEDKTSLDWDYNDVVFDVEYNGVVLRAVGGTLPVFLEVVNPKNNQTYTVTTELHTLMAQKQTAQGMPTTAQTFVGSDGKTYFKPINVGASNGVKLDPARAIEWTGNARLTGSTEYLTNFSNVKLMVVEDFGTDATSVSYNDAVERGTVKDVFYEDGTTCPAIYASPVNVLWVKEMKKVSLGYPYFYKGKTEDDSTTPWYEASIVTDYIYNYTGDGQ